MQNTDKEKELQQKHADALKKNRNKMHERKARTHRLIVRGAIAEKAIENSEYMTDTEFEEALFRAIEIADYYMGHSNRWLEENSQSESVGDSHGSDSR